MGYSNVAHYPEGKQGWMEAGLPVEKSAWRDTTPEFARACAVEREGITLRGSRKRVRVHHGEEEGCFPCETDRDRTRPTSLEPGTLQIQDTPYSRVLNHW